MSAFSTARDGLASLARLAATGCAIAWDGVAARNLPRSLAGLDARWLNEALGTSFPGCAVDDFEVVDHHAGTTARARLALTYRERAGAPEALFLKIAPPALVNRLFVAAAGLARSELGFYRDVRPSFPVAAPVAYTACGTPAGSGFALLLEDLAAAGARFARVGDHVDVADAERILDALAMLHAAYWESPRFAGDLAWVPHWERRRTRDMPWERFVTSQMVALAVRRHAGELDDPALEIAARYVADERDALESLLARGERTLVHGDCHVGNLYFLGADVGFYDWQVCARAPGMRDVSYFLCNSFPAGLRAEHERGLIERYLGALEGQGVRAPRFDTAFEQHRLYALYTFIAASFTVGAGDGLQPIEVGLAGMRRALTAVRELDSVACARTLAS